MRQATRRLACGTCGVPIENGQFCDRDLWCVREARLKAWGAPNDLPSKETLLRRLRDPQPAMVGSTEQELKTALIAHPFDNLASFVQTLPVTLHFALGALAPELVPYIPVEAVKAPEPDLDELPGTTVYKHPRTLKPYKTRADDGVRWEETGVFNVEHYNFDRVKNDITVAVVFPPSSAMVGKDYKQARVRAAMLLAKTLRDGKALFLFGRPDFWTFLSVSGVVHAPEDMMVRFRIHGDHGSNMPSRGCAIKAAP